MKEQKNIVNRVVAKGREMGEMMRMLDWSNTAIGKGEKRSQS